MLLEDDLCLSEIVRPADVEPQPVIMEAADVAIVVAQGEQLCDRGQERRRPMAASAVGL